MCSVLSVLVTRFECVFNLIAQIRSQVVQGLNGRLLLGEVCSVLVTSFRVWERRYVLKYTGY